jgi:hypothetical protein
MFDQPALFSDVDYWCCSSFRAAPRHSGFTALVPANVPPPLGFTTLVATIVHGLNRNAPML